jgi:hypothetical protein
MSPLMMRFFTLAGIALAAASMQLKARADTPAAPPAQIGQAQQAQAGIPADAHERNE